VLLLLLLLLLLLTLRVAPLVLQKYTSTSATA
jgi:hypothetical protein